MSRNHQHFALTGYITLIACHRRLSTLHRRRQSNTASFALFWINTDLLHLATFLLGRHKEGANGMFSSHTIRRPHNRTCDKEV